MMLFDDQNDRKKSTDIYEIRRILEKVDIFSLDLETTGLDYFEDKITIFAFAAEVDGEVVGWTIETRDYPIKVIYEVFFDLFHNINKTIVFHNASFDIQMLNSAGIYINTLIADTRIMAWLLDEDRIRHGGYALKHCVLKHLGYRMSSYTEARSLFGDFEDYAADDAVQTLKLYYYFKEGLDKIGLTDWFRQVEMPITKLLIETEKRGVKLDKKQLKQLKIEAWGKVAEIEKQIHEMVGYKFDVASPKQLSNVLFSEFKYGMSSDGKTNKYSDRGKVHKITGKIGDWSTAVSVLEAMKQDGIELAGLLLKFREINTRLNTFIRPNLERCRDNPIIHPKFNQIGTVTGRFSSKNPNYQNLPRKGGIRRAFIARDGFKICRIDYSQAELRLLAHMSEDPIMIKIYLDNGDIHQVTADACGISRQGAKEVNFGLCYRMSAKRLQSQLAMQDIHFSIEECYSFVKKYFKKYKNVRDYHKRIEKVVMNNLDNNGEYGYIRTLGGRYRRSDREYLVNPETAFSGITQLINTTIQGGVSDLIKVAMVSLQNAFRKNGWLDPEHDIWDACIQGQVHDEIFIECREELADEVAAIAKKCMENAGRKYKICVPMIAEPEIVDCLAKKQDMKFAKYLMLVDGVREWMPLWEAGIMHNNDGVEVGGYVRDIDSEERTITCKEMKRLNNITKMWAA